MDFMEYHQIKVIKKSEGYALLEMPLNKTSLNIYDYVHGGVYFSLSDSAAGYATADYDGTYITLNSSISYLKAIKEGVLKAEAKLIHKSRKTAVFDVRTFSEDVLCTQATITMYKV